MEMVQKIKWSACNNHMDDSHLKEIEEGKYPTQFRLQFSCWDLSQHRIELHWPFGVEVAKGKWGAERSGHKSSHFVGEVRRETLFIFYPEKVILQVHQKWP